MAKEEVVRRRKRSRRKSHSGYSDGGKETRRGKSLVTSPISSAEVGSTLVTADEPRKATLAHLKKAPEEHRMLSMKYVGETVQRGIPADTRSKEVAAKRRHRQASDTERRRHRKHQRADRSSDDSDHVYSVSQAGKSEYREKIKSTTHALPTVVEEGESHGSLAHKPPRRRHTSDYSARGNDVSDSSDSVTSPSDIRIKPHRRKSDPIWRPSVPRQRSPSPRRRQSSTPQRASSAHESLYSSRPSIRRSSTSAFARQESVPRMPPKRSLSTASVTTKSEKKPTGILQTFLKGPGQLPQPIEKKVTCLTCGDDIAASRSAKLACGHRMCHTCLKRVFTMSVTDPAHMPPKCCTSEHIPLKHVDKLFNQKFKVAWNRKFEEYTTRNRIYCPTKGCGEWIKPNHITIEQGRKVGKCKKCGFKVCGTCNNRMHTSKECPKDEATKQFVEVAKKEGWQRCYNCKAMVELKEGCNHMTCRCTAEFCMICGNRWKTCDCPWFNYEAVEADRLLHMNIPEARRLYANGGGRAPLRYQEEMEERREQVQRDEELARRMEEIAIETIGMGNAAGHFMNQDFRQQPVDFLSGNIQQITQAMHGLLNGAITGRENPLPPGPLEIQPQHPLLPPQPPDTNVVNLRSRQLRQHSAESRAFNRAPTTRPSERVVPGRRVTDYSAEAARHRPLSGRHPPSPPSPPSGNMNPSPAAVAARRASLRRSATGPPIPSSSSRRASAMAEMVTNDQVTMDEMENRINNWMRRVPVGEPGPDTQVDDHDEG